MVFGATPSPDRTLLAFTLFEPWRRLRTNGYFAPSGLPSGFSGDRLRVVDVRSSKLMALPLEIGYFCARLIRLRWGGADAYAAFAGRYVDAFERKWLAATGDQALGTSDIQSLADVGGSFERVRKMRVVIVPRAVIAALVGGAVLPMVPLVLAEVGAARLVAHLAKAIFF